MKIVIRQQFNLADRLEGVAEFYDYSSRRVRDQVVKGKVLGLSYEPGLGFVFFLDGHYEILGPVADIPTKFMLPVGTTCVGLEVRSGAVSGLVYQGQLKKKQHPEVELMAEAGCSGVIVKVLPFKPPEL